MLIYYLALWITFLLLWYELPQFSSLNNASSLPYSSVHQNSSGLGWLLCPLSLKVAKGWAFIKRLWEESASQHIQIVSKIQFHVVVGLKSPFPCCLLGQGSSPASQGCPHSLSSIFKASNGGSSLLTLKTCTSLSHLSSASLLDSICLLSHLYHIS